jgi:hypothetical protein
MSRYFIPLNGFSSGLLSSLSLVMEFATADGLFSTGAVSAFCAAFAALDWRSGLVCATAEKAQEIVSIKTRMKRAEDRWTKLSGPMAR